jgi:signal transduction histidine kinase/transcriptional regulator with XRE-family HTH domain/ActR/RegA family two-component response regulator
MSIRTAIMRLRSELGLTQTELANMLHVSFATVNRWENGKVIPNPYTASAVMEIINRLDVSSGCIDELNRELFSREKEVKENIPRIDMGLANQIINESSSGIFVSDSETHQLLYVNSKAEGFVGKSIDNMDGLKCYSYFMNRDKPCETCPISGLSKESFFDKGLKTEDGRFFHLRGKLVEWQGTNALIQYISDETVYHETQTELDRQEQSAQEAMFRKIIHQSGIRSLEIDAASRQLLKTEGFSEACKKRLRKECWRTVPDIFFTGEIPGIHPEDQDMFRKMFEEAFAGKPFSAIEVRVYYDDVKRYLWSRLIVTQTEAQDKAQNKAQDEVQNKAQGEAQGKVQNKAQDEAQDEVQNKASGRLLGTCQIIHAEKQAELRYQEELRIRSQLKENLIASSTVNLSKNIVEEIHVDGISVYNDSFRECMDYKERAGYFFDKIKMTKQQNEHLSAGYLLEKYQRGLDKCSEDYFAVKRKTGEEICIHVECHLFSRPETRDIIAMFYNQENTEGFVSQQLMKSALNNTYESAGVIFRNTRTFWILNDGKIDKYTGYDNTVGRYMKEYLSGRYSKEEVEQIIQENTIERVILETEQGKIHSSTFEIQDKLENIKKKEITYYRAEQQEDIICLYVMDITNTFRAEMKKQSELEKALDIAERATQAKTDFLSRMSHEIRTPMNAILGMIAIAKGNRADCTQVMDCMDKIDTSSQYLLSLLNDILEMSRIESGRIEVVKQKFELEELLDSINTVVGTLARDSEIRYEYVRRSEMDAYYIGDRMRIQQIIVNIISNAIKFTKKGGRVRFSTQILEQTKEMDEILFCVADTGVGMSEEFMKRMYEPFSQENGGNTTKYSGSGLGLAIARNLAEAMGGNISAESYLGIGTTFRIQIPLGRVVKSEYMEQPEGTGKKVFVKPKTIDEIHLDGYRILMAEDHPMNIMVAKRLLESRGMIVTVAENGKLAVDIFRKSREGFFDAILMDIRMPVMDGLDAARAIRSMKRSDSRTIPIIAMTANAMDEDRKNTKDAGMNAHLAKPFQPMQMYQILEELIRKE